MTLSVCLIVKNEEPVLRRCLACAVQFADELIVVDTGSTDNSAAIAREYTPYVYLHPWQNSFAEARNYSYSKATGDYIMWLDADDVVTDENIGKINRLKEEVDNVDLVFMINKDYTESGITSYILRDRIIRRTSFRSWHYNVHEAISTEACSELIYRPDIGILHKKEYVNEPERNMNIFNDLVKEEKPLSLHEKSNLVRELSLHGKTEEALVLFHRICSSLPSSSYGYAFTYLMVGLQRAEQWSKCLELIEGAEKHIKPSPRMIYTKGVCMDKLGKVKEAEKLYHEALASTEDPLTMSTCYTGYNDYFPYLRLAELVNKRGDMQETMRFLNCAKNAYPKDINWRITKLSIMLNIENPIKNNKEENTMAKSEKELNELKQEIDKVTKKLQELSDEDLEKVTGGCKTDQNCNDCIYGIRPEYCNDPRKFDPDYCFVARSGLI